MLISRAKKSGFVSEIMKHINKCLNKRILDGSNWFSLDSFWGIKFEWFLMPYFSASYCLRISLVDIKASLRLSHRIMDWKLSKDHQKNTADKYWEPGARPNGIAVEYHT